MLFFKSGYYTCSTIETIFPPVLNLRQVFRTGKVVSILYILPQKVSIDRVNPKTPHLCELDGVANTCAPTSKGTLPNHVPPSFYNVSRFSD
jgi:hypothetical protein